MQILNFILTLLNTVMAGLTVYSISVSMQVPERFEKRKKMSVMGLAALGIIIVQDIVKISFRIESNSMMLIEFILILFIIIIVSVELYMSKKIIKERNY